MCVPLSTFHWAAFSVACFWGLSDVCSAQVRLKISLLCLDRQSSGWESPHNWLARLSIDLAIFCYLEAKETQLGPFDSVNFVQIGNPAASWLPTVHPYMTACWKLSKMASNSASSPMYSWSTERAYITIDQWRIVCNQLHSFFWGILNFIFQNCIYKYTYV